MAHLSEASTPLKINTLVIDRIESLEQSANNFPDVCLVILPATDTPARLNDIDQQIQKLAAVLNPEATLIILGNVLDLVKIHTALQDTTRYQLWIALKRKTILHDSSLESLSNQHFGALVHTKYQSSLRHTKTRIGYSYCPACDLTTKDYGGKKHTYHAYGTLMSDVWRDIACDLESDLTPILKRFADLFGVPGYHELRVLDCRVIKIGQKPQNTSLPAFWSEERNHVPREKINTVIHGDCLEELKNFPNNSIDFVFADPPYNLKKEYVSYTDDLVIKQYFEWCDKWLNELARVLKPGGTCAVLNIPLWAIRHFIYLETILNYQNWISWDALSFPVRLIMPAHYTILCFSKGKSRQLPGLSYQQTLSALKPLAEGYCLRSTCIRKRKMNNLNDRAELTDLWWDIHRLKHNSRRVDHPTQLPPQLMYRLISLFTNPNEIVLDCFNGAGTTTLAAHQLGRKYIGIEISEEYYKLALERHEEIKRGLDPFRKEIRELTAKNSPVPRLKKQKYLISKKALQLEVKRIANEIGRLPNRQDVIKLGKYPIDYYDSYFASWGEVCAAARTTGMSEKRVPHQISSNS